MSEDDYMRRVANANEAVALATQQKLQQDTINAQVSLEWSLRQAALSAATAVSGVFKFEKPGQILNLAENYLAWLRDGTRK